MTKFKQDDIIKFCNCLYFVESSTKELQEDRNKNVYFLIRLDDDYNNFPDKYGQSIPIRMDSVDRHESSNLVLRPSELKNRRNNQL